MTGRGGASATGRSMQVMSSPGSNASYGTGTAPDVGDARAKVRSAALRLFHRQGFPATSVQQIVLAAGVTKGTFYYYWESKKQILQDLHDEFLDDELARARAVLARRLPLDQTLRALVTELLLSVELHQDAITVYLADRRSLSDKAAIEVKLKRDEFEHIVTSTIEQGIEEGVFEPVRSARLLCFGIMGMCAWAHEWYRPDGPVSATEVADLYCDVLLNGLHR